MRAQLQKQQAYRYKGRAQYKHVIVIPEEAVSELSWKGGQQLELTIDCGKLVVEAKEGQVLTKKDDKNPNDKS
jgi:bifunctional DNA-binding transcriptional regulator/antitoxin component of YhaV-PrlF toxin-antitoxin module